MNISLLSKRYAKALFLFAKDKKAEDIVHTQMKELVAAFDALPALMALMIDPVIPSEKKAEVLFTAVTGDKEVYCRFINLVLQRGRETSLRNIGLMYEELYCDEKDIYKGTLVTAVEPTEKIVSNVSKIFDSVITGRLELEKKVDPKIEGGFILLFDTYRIDVSVKRQLKSIKKQFEIQNNRMG